MLVLSRKVEQSLIIAGDIVVTILGVDGDRVRVGISAPPEVSVVRQEVRDRGGQRRPGEASARAASGKANPPPTAEPVLLTALLR